MIYILSLHQQAGCIWYRVNVSLHGHVAAVQWPVNVENKNLSSIRHYKFSCLSARRREPCAHRAPSSLPTACFRKLCSVCHSPSRTQSSGFYRGQLPRGVWEHTVLHECPHMTQSTLVLRLFSSYLSEFCSTVHSGRIGIAAIQTQHHASSLSKIRGKKITSLQCQEFKFG